MPIEVLSVDTVHQGYCAVRLARLRMADGSTQDREVEDHGQAAAVLPYDPHRRCALLARLPRAPVIVSGGPQAFTEAAAGMIEQDDTPEATVRREALEELGVRLDALEPVGRPWSTPGVSTERIALFLAPYARTDRVADGGGVAGEGEHIEVLEVPLAELAVQADVGDLLDLKTLALVLALRVRRPDLFAG